MHAIMQSIVRATVHATRAPRRQINSQKKSFMVAAKTPEECKEWRSAIEGCIASCAKASGSGDGGGGGAGVLSVTLAPRWVADAAVPACQVGFC